MGRDRTRGREKGQRGGRVKRNPERCVGRERAERGRTEPARLAARAHRKLRGPPLPPRGFPTRAGALTWHCQGARDCEQRPARLRRRLLPGAQPRADPSRRRGSAAGLSGPGENKGARRRGRGKEAPPAEERRLARERRALPPTLPGQSPPPRLPGCGAHTDASEAPPGPARSAAGYPGGTAGLFRGVWRRGPHRPRARAASTAPAEARREVGPRERALRAPASRFGLGYGCEAAAASGSCAHHNSEWSRLG